MIEPPHVINPEWEFDKIEPLYVYRAEIIIGII